MAVDDDNTSAGFGDNATSSSDVSPSLTSLRFVVPVAALVGLNLAVVVGNSLVIADHMVLPLQRPC